MNEIGEPSEIKLEFKITKDTFTFHGVQFGPHKLSGLNIQACKQQIFDHTNIEALIRQALKVDDYCKINKVFLSIDKQEKLALQVADDNGGVRNLEINESLKKDLIDQIRNLGSIVLLNLPKPAGATNDLPAIKSTPVSVQIATQEQQTPHQPQQLQPLPISASDHKDVGTVTSEIKYDNSRTDQSNRDKKGQVLNAAVKAKINSEWLKTKEKKQAAIRDGVKSKVNKSADNKPNK